MAADGGRASLGVSTGAPRSTHVNYGLAESLTRGCFANDVARDSALLADDAIYRGLPPNSMRERRRRVVRRWRLLRAHFGGERETYGEKIRGGTHELQSAVQFRQIEALWYRLTPEG